MHYAYQDTTDVLGLKAGYPFLVRINKQEQTVQSQLSIRAKNAQIYVICVEENSNIQKYCQNLGIYFWILPSISGNIHKYMQTFLTIFWILLFSSTHIKIIAQL